MNSKWNSKIQYDDMTTNTESASCVESLQTIVLQVDFIFALIKKTL